MSDELDTAVKLAVYHTIAESGATPSSADLARTTGMAESVIREAFGRLHGKRLLVPEPGDPGRIRMAPPFSGIATPFPVEARGHRYHANCVWDALGIPAALHADAVIPAADAWSGEPIVLEVRDGRPLPCECVAHFAVPAARWWEDIVYT